MNLLISAVTDWLLILIGGLLVFKALFAVDVAVARYVIIGLGVLLSGAGLWFRHRRKQRCR
ncbi:MAG: LPXTG cell wall anchor domain-containing protein [Desulfobulbaceae bacterium]|nr:LPXTG cell wall anchor domain-containing protein [Desulfobulbaceae bacterium]